MAASRRLAPFSALAMFVFVAAIGWPVTYLIRLLFDSTESLTEALLNAGITAVFAAAGVTVANAWMTRGNSGPVDRRRNAVVALLVGCLLFGGLTALALLTDHPSHAVLFGSVGILVLALAIRELRAAPTAPAIGARAR